MIESNTIKDKFFNIIAHDLRHPFNAILGLSEVLLVEHKEYNDEKKDELIKLIVSSSQTACSLIDNLLHWTKSQTNTLVFNPDNYKLIDLFTEAISEVQLGAENKEINLSYELKDNINIYVDKNMISTVLRNLLSNEIKFTKRNGKILLYSSKNKKEIIISIKNNGIGISYDIQKNIFYKDETKERLGTENEKEIVLGLLLCKEFLKKHNGKI